MPDFEKLGVFYLGKKYDPGAGILEDELLLYDSKDLTTHAVIIGMTGSGKTGLGIGLIEEAVIDNIPVLAIDPKGDLGNLLLAFPEMKPEDLKPWVNAQDAAAAGISVDEHAQKQAALWRKGLAEWGQDCARIGRYQEAAEFALYTPGSSAGIPICVLRSFKAPSGEVRQDRDLFRERLQATATSILGLLNITTDPITSREHILLSNILNYFWEQGKDLDLAGLITSIQTPPITQIGVMNLDLFFPPQDRFGLSMQLNNLMAAPGFEIWREGEPLDVGRLLYTQSGKPRVSVISINHLSDSERMFFVSMLLNEVVSWMRSQSGTSSLRALLYLDEIFGYMPPTANPPSKVLLLTLLKQARAFGLGVVLATQNPVDLDYKGLSNAGTWFLGRLQTERDKARVMEGLESVSAGEIFDKGRMERIIASLGKRIFLMHNVHENAPVVFQTRWTLSYLSGPFTRDQIKSLAVRREPSGARLEAGEAGCGIVPPPPADSTSSSTPPVLPAGIKQYYAPLTSSSRGTPVTYYPKVAAACEVTYVNERYNVRYSKKILLLSESGEGPVSIDWAQAELADFGLESLEMKPRPGATYAECPASMQKEKSYQEWNKLLGRWIRISQFLSLYQSNNLGVVSNPGESEGDFRIRLTQTAREQRDEQVEAVRGKYAVRIASLQERLRRAGQAIEREAEQSRQKKMETAISFGSAVLSAFLGRKVVSVSSASRVGTAMRSASRMNKESQDVERARENAETIQAELAELNNVLQNEAEKISAQSDPKNETFQALSIQPKTTDIFIPFLGLLWIPYAREESNRLVRA